MPKALLIGVALFLLLWLFDSSFDLIISVVGIWIGVSICTIFISLFYEHLHKGRGYPSKKEWVQMSDSEKENIGNKLRQ